MGNLDTSLAATLYHGTDETFDKYQKNSFFSTSAEFSKHYGKVIREEKVILGKTFDTLDEKCIQKLMDSVGALVDPYDDQEYSNPTDFINKVSSDTWETIEPHLPNIESMGYDSVRIFEGGIENYVVLNAENILSSKDFVGEGETMKPIEIRHHLAGTSYRPPTFIILMSDGKEYISCETYFLENTPENQDKLINVAYALTKSEMESLLQSPMLADKDLVDGRYMFAGCTSLTEAPYYPNLKFGQCMYKDCVSLVASGCYPSLTHAHRMYYGCSEISSVGYYPDLIDHSCMYEDCPLIEEESALEMGM